jgi:hypothetical protein
VHIIPGLRRLRQEDQKFEASKDYIVRPCLKKIKINNKISQNVTTQGNWVSTQEISL